MNQEASELEGILNVDNVDTYKNKKAELGNLLKEKTKGCILRSKIRWAEEGEKITRYFFNCEKRNAIHKNIGKLNVNDTMVTYSKLIRNAEYNFHSNLYADNNL